MKTEKSIQLTLPLFTEVMDKLEIIEKKIDQQNQQPSLEKTILSLQEVCKILQVGKRTLSNWDKANKLKPLPNKIGKKLYRSSDVEAFLEGRYNSGRRAQS